MCTLQVYLLIYICNLMYLSSIKYYKRSYTFYLFENIFILIIEPNNVQYL